VAESPSDFRFLGRLQDIEVIARGRSVDVRGNLTETFGGRNWRKMKGFARIEDDHGRIGDAEIHWFEAHGVGRVRWKIKHKFF
jgi:hypothetical protein